jgi:predicted PurR-regulated permease PerM
VQKKQITTLFLGVLTAISLYFCYLIARPFLGPFLLAAMIAIVFHPVHAYFRAHVRGPNRAALLSTLLVLLLFIIPAAGLGAIVSNEFAKVYQWLSENSAQEGGWTALAGHTLERILNRLGRYIDLSAFDLRGSLLRWLQQISKPLLYWQAQAVSNVAVFMARSVLTFLTLFFLFREGGKMTRRLAAILPLSSSQIEHLFTGISNSIIANVYGCLAVGAVQGTFVALAFWVLGVPSPALWGLVTALFSMVPLIGSASVWVPACIILAFSGHWWKALALLGWGALVVAQSDNVIRAYVISKRANLHPLAVFFATLGGIQAFGVIGIFVGPVILSVTLVVFELLKETTADRSIRDLAA